MARYLTISFLLLAICCPAGSAHLYGQDPGQTKPTLEALVGNSSQIAIVRVKAFELNAQKRAVVRLDLQVVQPLKRPWLMPGKTKGAAGAGVAAVDGTAPQVADSSLLTFSKGTALRYYDQAHWGLDFTAPLGGLEERVADWHKQQTELLLFKDFETPELTVQMLVDLQQDRVIQDDWSLLADAAAVRRQTQTLIDRYRGVERLRLVLVDVGHFAPAASALAGGKKLDLESFKARCFYMPADAQYEKLLLEQIRHPQYLHNDGQPVMTYRVEWLRYTRDIYSFASERNAATLRQLLTDPKVGSQQRALLKEILTAWQIAP